MTASSNGAAARQRAHLPAGSTPTRRQRPYVPLLAGLLTVAVVCGIVAATLRQFRGGFTESVPITVISHRAGLVMYPGAKVKIHGAQVGTVASIEDMPDGQATIHLAIEPRRLHLIPANVFVNIAATTAFGAKYIQLVPPDRPSSVSMRANQVLDADHVTVEVNTVFQQLTSVLARIDPAKLNETLGAMAVALNGRGDQTRHALSDLNSFLAEINPSLQNLSHDFNIAPNVLNAYADAAPDVVRILGNTIQLSQTIVDQQKNLDMLLISTIGLADIGNDVVGGNRQALTDVLHLLVPTTDLTNEYHEALDCGLKGMVPMAENPPDPNPGFTVLAGLSWGVERYRYPGDLPKVAATGGPQCKDELPLQFNNFPPYVVADVGTNPFKYGNQQNLLNSDLLKQILYGPLDGPPRNTAQIGQPG